LFNHGANQAQPIGNGPCFFDFGCKPLGGAPIESFARVDEVVEGTDGFFDGRVSVGSVCVEDIDVGELEPREGGLRAFNEVFARDAEVVDFVAWGCVGRVVGTPVDLCVRLVWRDMSTL
jgi:hypothetical protein